MSALVVVLVFPKRLTFGGEILCPFDRRQMARAGWIGTAYPRDLGAGWPVHRSETRVQRTLSVAPAPIGPPSNGTQTSAPGRDKQAWRRLRGQSGRSLVQRSGSRKHRRRVSAFPGQGAVLGSIAGIIHRTQGGDGAGEGHNPRQARGSQRGVGCMSRGHSCYFDCGLGANPKQENRRPREKGGVAATLHAEGKG